VGAIAAAGTVEPQAAAALPGAAFEQMVVAAEAGGTPGAAGGAELLIERARTKGAHVIVDVPGREGDPLFLRFLPNVDAVVLGMGQIGSGAYLRLSQGHGLSVLGVDSDAGQLAAHRAAGRHVMEGDAVDSDFWDNEEIEVFIRAPDAVNFTLKVDTVFSIGTVKHCTGRVQPGQSNDLLCGARPGAPLGNTDVLAVDEALQADRCLAEAGLTLTILGEDHAAHQPQRQCIGRSTRVHAAQHHLPGHSRRLAQPAHHVDAGRRW
jgi:hypothetical protein